MNTLDLDDDLTDAYIVRAVEDAFDITLYQDEGGHMETLGDLYDCVVEKLGAEDGGRPVCFTAVSFYRLHSALIEIAGSRDIRPATPLHDLFPEGKIGRAAPELERIAGLKLPNLPTGMLTDVAVAVLLVGSPIAAWFAWDAVGWWALSAFLGWELIHPLAKLTEGKVPEHYPDVGSFARAMAGLNHSTLSQEFGVNNRTDVWNSLVEIVRNETFHSGVIDRETTFFPATP